MSAEGAEVNEQTTAPENYYEKRCKAIGLTEERNKLLVKEYKALPDSKVLEFPLLSEDKETGNIVIPLYRLDGSQATYYKDNPGKLANGKTKALEIVRFHPDIQAEREKKAEERGDKKPGKYYIPKGAKAFPWISPNLIEAYEQKREVDTIVITEGYIKAISGYLNGLHIFGLSGIQNSSDKDTGMLHEDILAVVKHCKVNNVVLLYDGDCINISSKALEEGKDLYQRPAGFYYSAKNINELLKDLRRERHFDVYFACVNTNTLDGEPKGLDDLYELHTGAFDDITRELTSFSSKKFHYFHKINITSSATKVLNHLHINNAETFHTFHNQVIKDKLFCFYGTQYKYDEEKRQLTVVIPAAARNYFRVGDNYYEDIFVPNKHGQLEYQYVKRNKSTIIDDHGKNLIQHIPKYKAFCIKPDHANYQKVINNCFNRYRPLSVKASDDPHCPEIMEFLVHIFGDQLELGLDYIQILYQRPQQMLPILCLVSKENNTGKSTFGKFLKAIFEGNMTMIGNADLENDFNSGWADKLLICCEESFIDKKKTVEKIKSLSTGDKIQMNQKGIDQVEVDFFGKFLFMSNNEENFVIANEHDERFWVRKVPKAEKERPDLLDIMIEERENFLCMLSRRILHVNKRESRMWFHPDRLKTEAFRKLIESNRSGLQKELTSILRNLFSDTGFWQLKLTAKYIGEKLLRNRYGREYVEKCMRDNFNAKAALTSMRFKVPEIQVSHTTENTSEERIVITNLMGKPYTFTADQFLTGEEIEVFELSEEAIFHGQRDCAPEEVRKRIKVKVVNAMQPEEVEQQPIHSNQQNDLPF
jgi:hypothetical protein